MNYKPLVSIVIPLYNGSNYVEEAIQSAIVQTYENIEIIVVNDGSTDGGAGKAICDKYTDKILYFEKENGGCASALNYGIKKSSGQFISWLSHDDLYVPNKIKTQIEIYEKHGLDMSSVVISNVGALINSKGEKILHPSRKETGFYSAQHAYEYFLFRACPNGCGMLIPKDNFEKYGYFDESLRFVLDWNLWLKFALSGVDFYFDDSKLVCNRVHSMQVTVKQKELHSKETNFTVNQLFEIMRENKAQDDYLKMLYYFAYAYDRGDVEAIHSYLREQRIKITVLKAIGLRMKSRMKRVAKDIYHKIR